jgi:tripartite-type tricarboxylate transporter receptor subunit TctC
MMRLNVRRIDPTGETYMRIGKACFFLALIGLVVATAAQAADKESYQGKTVQFIVGFAAGTGYDLQTRLIAHHLGNYLPGKPSVVVQNMPGAGSIRAADYIYFTAPKDGTVVGMIDPGVFNSQMLGEARIRFDTTKFTWIGRMVNNTPTLITWYKSPIQSTDDLFTKQAMISAAGPTPRLNYILLNTVLHAKIKTILGYSGSSAATIAMERGEVDGLTQPWPVIKLTQPEWIKDKKINVILQNGFEKDPDLPDVPRMIDLTKNEDDRKLFEFFALPSLLGRSVLAPPDIPAQQAKELRTAFQAMVKSRSFLDEAEKTKADIAPLTGDEIQGLMANNAGFSPSVIERAKGIVALDIKDPKEAE